MDGSTTGTQCQNGKPKSMTPEEFDKRGWDHTRHFEDVYDAIKYMGVCNARIYTLRFIDGAPIISRGAFIDHPITYVVAYKKNDDGED